MLGCRDFIEYLEELLFLLAQVFDRLDKQLLRLVCCFLVAAPKLLGEFELQSPYESE